LEAVAFQVTDLVRAMEHDLGKTINTLRVDGGMSQNSLLMQLQANSLGLNVERSRDIETTGLGAAYLAGLGAGVFESQNGLASLWKLDTKFGTEEGSKLPTENWRRAVSAAANY
jgi:glycerol kinase